MTRSGTVGHLSGHRVRPGLKGRAAFVAGVRHTDPEIRVLTGFCGTQDDNAVAGAFPLLVAAALALLAAITLVRNIRAPMDWQRPDPLAVVAVLGGVVAFAFVTPLLGVLPGAVLSVLATSAVVPEFRWPWKLALALSVAAGVWLVFVVGLGIPLTAIRGL